MMLAIDTSTPFLVVGLLGNGVALEETLEVGRGHAEHLPGALTALFGRAGNPKAEQIALGLGPGSYTGLRVGASLALGLGRAWNVPVVGVSSLEGVAARADEGAVAVSLDARRGQVYGAVYRVAGGQITQTLRSPEKMPEADFARQAEGLAWHRDEPPSGLALARLAPSRGQREWQLIYA